MNIYKKNITIVMSCILILTGLLLLKKKKGFSKPTGTENLPTSEITDPSSKYFHAFQNSENTTEKIDSEFAVDIEQVIEDYSEWAKYPPDSRPLLSSHADVLNPRAIPVSIQSMPVFKNGQIMDSGSSCQLQPEFHTVTEGKSLRIFLSCYQTGTDKRQKIKIDSTMIEGKAGKNLFVPPSISGNDSGFDGDVLAGDLTYTFHFRPRSSDWGDMNFSVHFYIEGDNLKAKHTLTHHFFSSPIAPAKFTGKFSDRILEGSLFIDIELQVIEPGRYTIEANLMSESEEPIGYARKDQKLLGGKQIVSLQYFGKVIVTARESGPYKLTNVRGTLNTDVIQEEMLTKSPEEVDRMLSKITDDRPKHKTIPYFEGSYFTGEYQWNEFDSKDYDSLEKRQRLADLKMLRK